MDNKYVKESEAKVKVGDDEICDLIIDMFQLDEDADYVTVEDKIHEEFEISYDAFKTIVERLLPYASEWGSPLLGDHYKGFSKTLDVDKNCANKIALVKYAVKDM